ncbi:hypothetical protein [Methyloversatilis thermotolerans]|uniref:hypothetical protein n=1 Tax=Methyloversatilis thermotolerans TaxID=1346290 RepID=UPI00036723ED|nr:hypothetical protein [Methyloversatilis thermotolerans]
MMSHPALVPPPATGTGEHLMSRAVSVLSVTQIKGAFHVAHVQLENGRYGDVPCDPDVTKADRVGLFSSIQIRNGRIEARLRLRRLHA